MAKTYQWIVLTRTQEVEIPIPAETGDEAVQAVEKWDNLQKGQRVERGPTRTTFSVRVKDQG